MMDRSDDPDREIWGTWEELLLACAVSRHGTRSWDSVAMEIQSRSTFPHLLTPQSCLQRYRDLQRRFAAEGNGTGDDDSPPEVPWLEELRKQRVAELRREVERYDLSIGSLQLKVKKLEEERERRIREVESGEEKANQVKEEGLSQGSTPETVARDRISGGDSGPSCEESNSTDPKEGKRKPEEERREAEGTGGEPTDHAAGDVEKLAAAVGEGSCNGSTEGPVAEREETRPQVGESGESIAESKDGKGEAEEAERENSDVQSSASLSKRRRKAFSGSTSSGEEVEAEVSKLVASESKSLVAFLDMLRSDKHGSVFDRRLESQDSDSYRSLIRQHVDLEMVRSRLELAGSGRSYAAAEFFRDLLLLCANAVVFYPKDSAESVAAMHLRKLVSKEMNNTLRRPAPPPPFQKKLTPLSLSKPAALKPKPDPGLAATLLDKPVTSTMILAACRKRSSISNKGPFPAAKEEKDEKPEPARKEKGNNEEKILDKKNTKERSVLSVTTRGLRTNKSRASNGGGGASVKRPIGSPTPSLKSKPTESASATEAATKPDKKSSSSGAANSAVTASRKQGAANFLNRMKRSLNGTPTETIKGSSSGGGGGKSTELKKGNKGDSRKDQGSFRHGSSGGSASTKKAAEMNGQARRSVGRPPKRAAPLPTPPVPKRAREEAEPSKPPPPSSKKRGRR